MMPTPPNNSPTDRANDPILLALTQNRLDHI